MFPHAKSGDDAPSYDTFVLNDNTLESHQRQPFENVTGDDKIRS
jgi:hypothetical protein